MSAGEHRSRAPAPGQIRVSVLTVSDSRTPGTDEGGRLAAELCRAAGFAVAGGEILPDDARKIATRVRALAAGGGVEAVLVTGGTGISGRDVTAEACAGIYDKALPGYGELFRWLSFAEVGPAAMLSRASAGIAGGAAVFTMPGSPAGVRLALERLILPELAHVVGELRRHAHDHDHAADRHHVDDRDHARHRHARAR